MVDLSTIDVLTLVPVSVFARRIGVDRTTVMKWTTDGRMNRNHTRLVKLTLPRCPFGFGINEQIYREFIEELNRP